MMDKDISFILRLAAITAAFVVWSVVVVMLIGLFDPLVDNAEIFKIIGPAFSTVIGIFAGFLGGVSYGKTKEEK